MQRLRSHYTGKERDLESQLDYFGARYYSFNMGRFMSPDWAAKVAPVPYAKLDDPQSLNLYAYVRNNPLTRVDLNGHCDGLKDAGCWFWQAVTAVKKHLDRVNRDIDKLNGSTEVKFEAGFGFKGALKAGPFDVHAGVTLHDEKVHKGTDRNLSDGAPIEDHLEFDAGAKLIKPEAGFEFGLKHSAGTGIEGYGEPKLSIGTESGGDVSLKGETLEFGVAAYDYIGAGVSVSTDRKAFTDLLTDIF